MVDLRFASSLQIMLTLGFQAKSNGGGLLTSKDLADGLGANPALVRKLLIPLSQAGLIETFKGKTGGAKIAKAPKDISLRDIYEASVVDKDIVCNRSTADKTCPVGSSMLKVFSAVNDGMEKAILTHLQAKTLQQVMAHVTK